jgi:hypothetical protein
MYHPIEQRWANAVNAVTLQHIALESDDTFVVTTNVLEEIEERLISANNILEKMLVISGQANSVFVTIPNPLTDWLRFNEYCTEWKKSRRSSLAGDMARDPNYLRIIGMGITALPFIFRQLQNELDSGEPDHWFVALWSITGINPIAPEHRGLIREMAKDWIKWGEQVGHINASMGIRFSPFR